MAISRESEFGKKVLLSWESGHHETKAHLGATQISMISLNMNRLLRFCS